MTSSSISSRFYTYAESVNFDDQAQITQFTEILFHNIDAIRSRALPPYATPFSFDTATHKFTPQDSTATESTKSTNYVDLEDFFYFLTEHVAQVAFLKIKEINFATHFVQNYDKIAQGLGKLSFTVSDSENRALCNCTSWLPVIKTTFRLLLEENWPNQFLDLEYCFKLLDRERHKLLKKLFSLPCIQSLLKEEGQTQFFICCLRMKQDDADAFIRPFLAFEGTEEEMASDFTYTLLDDERFAPVHQYLLEDVLLPSNPDKKPIEIFKKRCREIRTNPRWNEQQKEIEMRKFLKHVQRKHLLHFEPFKTLFKFLKNDLLTIRNPLEQFEFPTPEDDRVIFLANVLLKLDCLDGIDLKNSQHRAVVIECAAMLLQPKLKTIAQQIDRVRRFLNQYPETRANPELKALIENYF